MEHFKKNGGKREGAGRPAHKPTSLTQELVRTLFIAGWNEDRIAAVVAGGINAKTLRRYYRDQLDLGKAQVDAMVTQSLVLQALGGQPRPGEPLNWKEAVTAATIFYCKTRMGWKEPSGGDGNPSIVINGDGGEIKITMKLAPPRADDEDRSYRYGTGVVIPPQRAAESAG